jgi:CRP-like cAMP-binding protein
MSPEETLAALRASRLASELNDEQSALLATVMHLDAIPGGTVLVEEGKVDDHLYLVMAGLLGVVKNHGQTDAATLNTLSPGDFAGELAWLDGQPRFASLVALAPTKVLCLSRDAMESLLDHDGGAVYRLMRAIVRAVHQIQVRQSMQQSELSNYIFKQHGRY